jgi:hypothetical protein
MIPEIVLLIVGAIFIVGIIFASAGCHIDTRGWGKKWIK